MDTAKCEKITIDSSLPFDDKNCIFTPFYSEYLFCCVSTNIITCYRIDYNFKIINKFSIDIYGENSNLSSINNENYASLFFLNVNNYQNSTLYEYIIYPPVCSDIYKQIIVYQGFEINISDLFEIKTNNTYYLEFNNLATDYGNMTISGELLKETTGKIHIKNQNTIIYFISTNNKIGKNISISFNVSIKEITYYSKCKIDLTIIPCYISCEKCSQSNSSSNIYNHNCLIGGCKRNYYKSPLNEYNCFNLAEKDPSWYFDNYTNEFGLCHNECVTCSGPNNNDCLSCYNKDNNPDFSHLYLGQCIKNCPEGTYEYETHGFFICKKCFPNCKNCTMGGDDDNMNCNSCLNESSIKMENNCYILYDDISKSFYNPKNLNGLEITSCFELFGYYIKENTNECIPSKDNGYYISNNITGVISKCHSDCKTCSKNYTESSSNCDTCANNNYYLQEGNCVPNCSLGYYLEGYECKKCHDNCLTCYSSPYYINETLVDMQCIQCKKEFNQYYILEETMIQIENNCFPIVEYSKEKIIFNISELSLGKIYGSCLDFNLSIRYQKYQCIPRKIHTFYVLNNINNTGIIKDCDIACNTCFDEGNTNNTNCLSCNSEYFKTEDSDTNCILENLIPINYYKNQTNNIYYKCHENCYNCSQKYNNESDDMYCLSCPLDYYFLNGTSNCYNMSFVIENKNYYFSDIDNKFFKCYPTCSECLKKEPDEYNNYCVKCINDFYILENTTNCFNNSLLEKGYYLDNEFYIFRKCYENCLTCDRSFINNDMNCIICQNGLYKLNGTNNCYNKSLIDYGYYFKNDLLYKCHNSCFTCSDGPTYINANNDSLLIISNNCLSCDKSKSLYLVEHLNNCENINYTLNGYYLDKGETGIEILKKCYKSCKICEKDIVFDNLTQSYNHNCLECADNYYKIKNDINYNNCYGEEMLLLNYSLENNMWKLCHDNCYSCNGRPIINENEEIISQNCIKCIDNYNFMFGTKDCYNDSIIESGYFLLNDLMYHKCDIQCKTCFQKRSKCLSCDTEKGYYIVENKPIFECYNSITIGDNYILKDNLDNDTKNISNKKWIKCYSSCASCFDSGNDEVHNCSSCAQKNYFIYNTSNCITNNFAMENGYYYNYTYNQFTKCDIACLTCKNGYESGDTNCKKCNSKLGYYPLYRQNSKCYNSDQIQDGYFLDIFETPNTWKECHEKCERCSYKGNNYDMKCLSCRKNYTNPLTNKIIYLKLSKGNCIEGCPTNLFLTSKGDCVEICPNKTYQFILNTSCVDSCPKNFILNKQKTRCILSDETLTTTEFKKELLKNISSYVDSSSLINGSDFIAIVVSSDDANPVEQIKKGISAVDLGDCILELKKHYNIPFDENLIILQMESKNYVVKNNEKDSVNLVKNMEIEVYDNDGKNLDLSVCKSEIKVMKYIGDAEDLDIQTAMDFAEQGIDVFNTKDEFFNDKCHPFNNKNGTDIILSDRRDDLYQNATFCQDGCIYNGMNYQLMIANCLCDSSVLQGSKEKENKEDNDNSKLSLSNLANTFTDNLLDFNFDVIKCYNLVFNAEILIKNIGFFSMFTMLCLQIVFFIIFLIKRLKPIRNFMYIFEPFDPNIDPLNPPKKEKNNKLQKIYDIIKEENNIDDYNKDDKKEKEIKKTILINNLLENSKTKKGKKNNNKKKIKDRKDEMIVIEYDKDGEKYAKETNYKKSSDIDYSRNQSSKNKDFVRKTDLLSINKKINKLDKDKNDLNNINIPFFSTYEKYSKNYDDNAGKTELKPKKNQIIFSKIINIDKNNNQNNIISNSERENIHNSKALFQYKNIKDNLYNTKESKIQSFNNRLKYKSQKYKVKEHNNKEKENTIRETGANLNMDDKNNKHKINLLKYKNKVVNFALTDDDYQDMDFTDAFRLDKRSFLRMYWSYLVETQIILGTFFTSNFLYLFIVKLSFLISTFQISFFLNAFFYTDEYISDAYHNNGVLDFFSGLPKSIYSFLATLITTSLLGMLSNSKEELIDTIKNRTTKREYFQEVKSKIKKLRNKLIVYYIFLFLLGILFLYYVSAFCAVYRYSQKYWLYGCFESFGLDSLVAIVICIFLALFRFIALRKKIKCFYTITKIIGCFL